MAAKMHKYLIKWRHIFTLNYGLQVKRSLQAIQTHAMWNINPQIKEKSIKGEAIQVSDVFSPKKSKMTAIEIQVTIQ